jgi:S-adenosylmethionine-diacylglycerol 3-amino-3-carboxypropyl transferase
VKFLSRSPISLYALGIPPAQYDELVAAGNPIDILRQRVEKLACDFPVADNYFAWQAFTRGYDVEKRQAVPAYLRRDVYDVIRTRTDRVQIHHASLTDFLKTQQPGTIDRFVLLDAQDWMTPPMLNALWLQIDRAASSGARVIFRTAGPDSPLARKLAPELLAAWDYREAESLALHAKDRASIYGGFHLYRRRAPC